jgi:signal peptidase
MTTGVLVAARRRRSRAHAVLASARVFATAVVYAAIGFVAVVLLAVGGSGVVGFRTFTVLTGSMQPGIHPGDLVVDQSIPARKLRIGDVVTFSSPDPPKRLITHRVRRLAFHRSYVDVVTKGDQNDAVEQWRIPARGHVGLVRLHVPRLGYAFRYFNGRLQRLLTIVVPALLLGAAALRRIWRT